MQRTGTVLLKTLTHWRPPLAFLSAFWSEDRMPKLSLAQVFRCTWLVWTMGWWWTWWFPFPLHTLTLGSPEKAYFFLEFLQRGLWELTVRKAESRPRPSDSVRVCLPFHLTEATLPLPYTAKLCLLLVKLNNILLQDIYTGNKAAKRNTMNTELVQQLLQKGKTRVYSCRNTGPF